MNPFDFHTFVAEASGRDLAVTSPLAAELAGIIDAAAEQAIVPSDVAATQVRTTEIETQQRREALELREAAMEHAERGLAELKGYLVRQGLGLDALDSRAGDLKIFYDEMEGEAVISNSDGSPISLFLPSQNLSGILPLPPELKLDTLDIEGNELEGISLLPKTLQRLNCPRNRLTSLPPLPSGLMTLRCDRNRLNTLPDLPPALTVLSCWNNLLETLPPLPDNLTYLYCHYNALHELPPLPPGLNTLECYDNPLSDAEIARIKAQLRSLDVWKEKPL